MRDCIAELQAGGFLKKSRIHEGDNFSCENSINRVFD